MDQMLEVKEDVYEIINNILIASCDVKHYDQMLFKRSYYKSNRIQP